MSSDDGPFVVFDDEQAILDRLNDAGAPTDHVAETLFPVFVRKALKAEELVGWGVYNVVLMGIDEWAHAENMEPVQGPMMLFSPKWMKALIGDDEEILEYALEWYRSGMADMGADPKTIERAIAAI